MARLATFTLALLLSAIAGLQYMGSASGQSGGDGWITLFDGKNLDQWQAEAGNNAAWRIEDGSIAVEKMDKEPKAIVNLVSKQSFTNFELRAEFWVSDDANSGIYIRCTDPGKVNSKSAYEVNIFDTRPDPKLWDRRDRRCGQGRNGAENRWQMEHLRHRRHGLQVHRHAQRRQNRGWCAGQPLPERTNCAPVRPRHGQVPQGADQAAVGGLLRNASKSSLGQTGGNQCACIPSYALSRNAIAR